MNLKALTVLQPYASLIAGGHKKYETRCWSTKYRGPIAIHAGKKDPRTWLHFMNNELIDAADTALNGALFYELPRSAVIAVAELVDCIEITGPVMGGLAILANGDMIEGNEYIFGNYNNRPHYAWKLANVRRIDPIPAKGLQRIWNWEVNENELRFRR
ncbi:MAG: hypothetical protein K0Q85_14 [Caproiciproducens sp.]|nr:hypothetical protein [Caproiciproducens sp.]